MNSYYLLRKKKKVITRLIFILFLFIPTALFAAGAELKNFGQSPIFGGIDQHGAKFSSAKLANSISVVNFFFTSCHGPCPILMNKVKLALDKSQSCAKVKAVSISVDPETDSSTVMKTYSEERGFDLNNWTLLNMPKERVIDLINSGFHLGQGESMVSHTTRIAIIDQFGSVRALIGGTDEDASDKISSAILSLCE